MATERGSGAEMQPPRTVEEFLERYGAQCTSVLKARRLAGQFFRNEGTIRRITDRIKERTRTAPKAQGENMRTSGRIHINFELAMAIIFVVATIFTGPVGCRNWNEWWEDHNQENDVFGGKSDYDKNQENLTNQARQTAAAEVAATAKAYSQPNGDFDGLTGWTHTGYGEFVRAYAVSQMTAPTGTVGKWYEEVKNTTLATVATYTELLGSVSINNVSCLTASGTSTAGETEVRIVFKKDDGSIVAVADYSASKYYKADSKTLGFVINKSFWTICMPGTAQPSGWFGKNGSWALRFDFLDGSLQQTVFWLSNQRIITSDGSLSSSYFMGPNEGTISTNAQPIDTTVRTKADLTNDPLRRGTIGGFVRHVERLQSGKTYNLDIQDLSDSSADNLATDNDPFEGVHPDNPNRHAYKLVAYDGFVLPAGVTITKVLVRTAGNTLLLEDDKDGREVRFLALLSNGDHADVTMAFPLTSLSYNTAFVELKHMGPNPTAHPDMADRLVAIPKAKGETSITATVPQTLGNVPIEAGTIKVESAIDHIELFPSTMTVGQGATKKFIVTTVRKDGTKDTDLNDVKFEIDPKAGAVNSATGDFTSSEEANALGSYSMKVTKRGAKDPAIGKVVVDKAFKSLKISPENFAVKLGGKTGEDIQEFDVEVTYMDDSKANASSGVELKVDSLTNATVLPWKEGDKKRKVQGKLAGPFKVTAIAQGKAGEISSNEARGIAVSIITPSTLTLVGPTALVVGQSAQYLVKDAAGNTVAKYSPAPNDSNLLAIDGNGHGIAKQEGTASVSVPGTTVTPISVTIKTGLDPIVPISFNVASLSGNVGDTGTVGTVVKFSNATTSTDPLIGTFSLTDEKDASGAATTGVVTILPSGGYTLAKKGMASVKYTVTVGSIVKSATLPATVNAPAPPAPTIASITGDKDNQTVTTSQSQVVTYTVKLSDDSNAVSPTLQVSVSDPAISYTVSGLQITYTRTANRSVTNGKATVTVAGAPASVKAETVLTVSSNLGAPEAISDQSIVSGQSGTAPAIVRKYDDTLNTGGATPSVTVTGYAWTSATPSIATIAATSGIPTGVSVGGPVLMTGTKASETTVSYNVTVQSAPIATITGDKDNQTVTTSQSQVVTYAVKLSDNSNAVSPTLQVSVSDPAISYTVSGLQITYTRTANRSVTNGKATVTVAGAPASVKAETVLTVSSNLGAPEAISDQSIVSGQSGTAPAIVRKYDDTLNTGGATPSVTVTGYAWTSATPSIATIAATSGIPTGVSVGGPVLMTGTKASETTVSYNVTVTAPPPAPPSPNLTHGDVMPGEVVRAGFGVNNPDQTTDVDVIVMQDVIAGDKSNPEVLAWFAGRGAIVQKFTLDGPDKLTEVTLSDGRKGWKFTLKVKTVGEEVIINYVGNKTMLADPSIYAIVNNSAFWNYKNVDADPAWSINPATGNWEPNGLCMQFKPDATDTGSDLKLTKGLMK